MAIIGSLSYLFYHSLGVFFLGTPLLIPYLKQWSLRQEIKLKKEFTIQAKDYLQSISSALKIGYAMENAMKEGRKSMETQYQSNHKIMKESAYMIRQISMNITAETALSEWSERVDIEELRQFVTVFIASKRIGGDSVEIIRKAVRNICEKTEVNREIDTVLAGKKYEFRIMSVVPLGMIGFMRVNFGDFMDVLYNTSIGRIIMSVCLLAYIVAYIKGKGIMEIEV